MAGRSTRRDGQGGGVSAFTIYPLNGEYFSVADEEAINAALAASGVRYTAEEPSELIDLRAEVEELRVRVKELERYKACDVDLEETERLQALDESLREFVNAARWPLYEIRRALDRNTTKLARALVEPYNRLQAAVSALTP